MNGSIVKFIIPLLFNGCFGFGVGGSKPVLHVLCSMPPGDPDKLVLFKVALDVLSRSGNWTNIPR